MQIERRVASALKKGSIIPNNQYDMIYHMGNSRLTTIYDIKAVIVSYL